MTLSIAAFQRAGQLKPQGELQVSSEQVSNRATLGNTVMSWIRSLGALLHLGAKPIEQRERQAQTLEAFRQAMTASYGADVTEAVTRGMSGALTGAKVNAAITAAKTAEREIGFFNQQQVAQMLPGEYVADPVAKQVYLRSQDPLGELSPEPTQLLVHSQQLADRKLDELCEKANVKDAQALKRLMDPQDNRSLGSGHTLYKTILEGLVATRSYANAKPIGDEELHQGAAGIIKSIGKAEFESALQVQEGLESFTRFSEDLKAMMSDIAKGNDDNLESGKDRAKLSLRGVLTAFKANGTIFSDDGWALGGAAVGKALNELPSQERSALFEAMLSPDNPLDDPTLDSTIYSLIKDTLTGVLEGRGAAEGR
jgi:hypothetical protein